MVPSTSTGLTPPPATTDANSLTSVIAFQQQPDDSLETGTTNLGSTRHQRCTYSRHMLLGPARELPSSWQEYNILGMSTPIFGGIAVLPIRQTALIKQTVFLSLATTPFTGPIRLMMQVETAQHTLFPWQAIMMQGRHQPNQFGVPLLGLCA
jgi:hypothetical protein